jgi:hypothetical protein
MLYVRVGPQEMTSCDVMTGQLLYDEEGAKPRGVVVFKLKECSVEASVSTWSPIQALSTPLDLCTLSSSCDKRLVLVRNK